MGYRARLRPRYHAEIAYDKDYDDVNAKKQDLLHDIEQLVQPGAKLTKAALKELVEQYRNNSDNADDETVSDDDYSDYSEDEDDNDEDKDKEHQYDMTPSTRSIGLTDTDNSSDSEDDYSETDDDDDDDDDDNDDYNDDDYDEYHYDVERLNPDYNADYW